LINKKDNANKLWNVDILSKVLTFKKNKNGFLTGDEVVFFFSLSSSPGDL